MNRFPFFYSYYTAYKKLSKESDKVKFIDAVMKYAFFGEEPDLPEYLDSMFDLARPNIDQSVKNAQQGAVNGKKGGAPKDMEYGTQNNTVSICTEDTTGRENIDYTKLVTRS